MNVKVNMMHNECGCGERHGHGWGGECGCHGGHHGHFRRHFITKAEKIERMEHYVEELKNELAAVQERIKELKATK